MLIFVTSKILPFITTVEREQPYEWDVKKDYTRSLKNRMRTKIKKNDKTQNYFKAKLKLRK